MVLLGLFFGTYFVYQFYKTFFWDNTKFEEKVAFVHIYEDDSFDDLLNKLSPLLISTNDFTAAAASGQVASSTAAHRRAARSTTS